MEEGIQPEMKRDFMARLDSRQHVYPNLFLFRRPYSPHEVNLWVESSATRKPYSSGLPVLGRALCIRQSSNECRVSSKVDGQRLRLVIDVTERSHLLLQQLSREYAVLYEWRTYSS